MAKSSGMINLTEADLSIMEKHPNEKAIEYGRQVPYHLQYIRKQNEKLKNNSENLK